MFTTLTISHYIFLNREERYSLFEGNPIETIGFNVPVWIDKINTSEPAIEVFCKYYLTNIKESIPITPNPDGYTLNLPQIFINSKTPSSIRLLDVKDGGCEEMTFKQYSKTTKDKNNFNIVHFIEIKPIEVLLQTIS